MEVMNFWVSATETKHGSVRQNDQEGLERKFPGHLLVNIFHDTISLLLHTGALTILKMKV